MRSPSLSRSFSPQCSLPACSLPTLCPLFLASCRVPAVSTLVLGDLDLTAPFLEGPVRCTLVPRCRWSRATTLSSSPFRALGLSQMHTRSKRSSHTSAQHRLTVLEIAMHRSQQSFFRGDGVKEW
eukprot:2215889-Rhodomonas_salina.4